MRKAGLIGSMLAGVVAAHVAGARGAEPSPTALQPAAVAMDSLVDKFCGSDPVERKLALRLERARLDEKVVTATKRCLDAQAHAAARGNIKLLRGLDAAAELSLRGCLQREDVHDPAVIAMLTDYVRAALTPDQSDRRRQRDYAACYASVLRCRQNPCPADPHRVTTVEPLTVSMKLLASDRVSGPFAPVTSGTPLRTGQTVKFQVTTSKRAFVYILQRSVSGTLTVLFPDAAIRAANPLPAGELQLPPGDSFTLEDPPGKEALIVVASEHEPISLVSTLTGFRPDSGDHASRAVEEALRKLDAAAGGTAGLQDAAVRSPASAGDDGVTRGLILTSRNNQSADQRMEPAFTARAARGDDTVVAHLGFLHIAGSKP